MVKRTCMDNATCPVARSLDAIGDWWSLLIVREAFINVRRFGDFQKRLGLAKNILTTRLRNLVAGGILEMRPASDGSAYQEYVLTEKGRSLVTVMVALRQWGEEYLYEPGEPTTILRDRLNKKPLAKLQVLSEDGRPLGVSDMTLLPAPVAADGAESK
ncbi:MULTISPECIES: winged helix-turn-helix transcriptional regulator [unclassified Janthinobacterium]|uniref:winged helix-turn-helix transcriptional regulator n=1 Tax=unclassified Janthinobacterium TaxID=2610881 RepID=UPI0004756FD7|nr:MULTISPECIES: helix-turn-helix domain-containing protein [unclassified Janthinobacterium]MEC5159976.1 DNA-binding HxlR family transcriptional regulator [Janthinobacterium sp. CG_S6]